ncbi:MAG TPA: cation:proton antiporter [Gemmatimonadaceae bacterium]|nr:cation:proton antiporter [Gemmatimonadaceae bacterium]
MDFARPERGTLSPLGPPRRVVVRGPYRYVPNPLYLAATAIMLGEATIVRSTEIALAWLAWFVCANIFVLADEEPYLRKRFGASYDEYTHNVRRSIPASNPPEQFAMSVTAGVILLYCVATVVAIITQRVRIPYTAALLLVGVALGASHVVALPHLTKDLLFAIFLPGLLFEAAYHLEVQELRENAYAIGALAVPGVVAAIAITALFLVAGSALLGKPPVAWRTALIFGGVIAATDPVAVTALFRQAAAPRRLHVLVESESLLNDGTSIVFLTLMLAFFAGESPTVTQLVVGFVRIAGGGVVVGFVIGWGISRIRTRLDDAAIEITLTTIAAYGAFVLAEQMHCSGVMATVAAGVVCGRTGRHHEMTAGTRSAVDSFWEWLAFALNSAVFLLLGAELQLGALAKNWRLVLVGVLAVLGARAIVVALVVLFLRRTGERMSGAWGAVLVWGGLRGALSLVLALALPASIEDRSLIVALTAGIVMVSLVGQGTTMSMLLRRVGVVGRAPPLGDPYA